ncbi:MAG: hypothetical protein SCARUB_05050 [Candidatus Scalindua rubra]|uniref:Uncharacterized protein n=1 Tax=Candidatus Scalindua rubra TaxID=1872076 RepID=A0A1E3X2I5_9BACT|nr:MAG: hypothetical protein SCARUB_05050 [Candidatus Scalindua rubra]
MINNIIGLFAGQNSKKRQIGIIAGFIATSLYVLGVIDFELFKFIMYGVGFWTGWAFSAKLTKMAKKLK